MAENWSRIGWQGVSLQCPAGWNLVLVTGDEKKGYFRVDSPEASSIEVRWSVLKEAPADLTRRANEFIDSLGKAARKRRVKITSKVKARKPTPAEERYGGSSVGFTWRGDKRAYGRVLYCGYCKRLVVAQVVGDNERELSGSASAILGSICEHAKQGWNVWALYDLEVPVPEDFRLDKHTLMSSFVELTFRRRRDLLVVQRWGLAANQLLKKLTLEEWAAQVYLPGVKGYRVSQSECVHEGLSWSGSRRFALLGPASIFRLLTGKGLPKRVAGCVWHCEESNRVYAVRHHRNGTEGLETVLRNEIECH